MAKFVDVEGSVVNKSPILFCDICLDATPHQYAGMEIVEVEHLVYKGRYPDAAKAVGTMFDCVECGARRLFGAYHASRQKRPPKGGVAHGLQVQEGREARQIGIGLV